MFFAVFIVMVSHQKPGKKGSQTHKKLTGMRDNFIKDSTTEFKQNWEMKTLGIAKKKINNMISSSVFSTEAPALN